MEVFVDGFFDGTHAYVENDPLNLTDPQRLYDNTSAYGDSSSLIIESSATPAVASFVPAPAAMLSTSGNVRRTANDLNVATGVPTSDNNVQTIVNEGTPGNNQAQNAQVRAIVRTLGLTRDQQYQLHLEISGQNYGYQEILQIAKDMFGK